MDTAARIRIRDKMGWMAAGSDGPFRGGFGGRRILLTSIACACSLGTTRSALSTRPRLPGQALEQQEAQGYRSHSEATGV